MSSSDTSTVNLAVSCSVEATSLGGLTIKLSLSEVSVNQASILLIFKAHACYIALQIVVTRATPE